MASSARFTRSAIAWSSRRFATRRSRRSLRPLTRSSPGRSASAWPPLDRFGVATAFEYRLHPVGPLVLGGPMFWPIADAPQVLRWLRDHAPDAPDDLGITLAMMLAPPLPFLPPEQRGRPVIGLIIAWFGDLAEGERAIAPLRQIGTPLADVVRPVPYTVLQSMLDGGAPRGRHYYWKSHRLPALSDPAIDVLLDRIAAIRGGICQINGWAMGGVASRVDPSATAVGRREVGFDLSIIAGWLGSDPDGEDRVAWVREGWDALSLYGSGLYANFISDEGEAGVEAAYGERVARLTALKDRYDPDNIFHLNANIAPSQGDAL